VLFFELARLSGGVPCTIRVCGGWVRDKLLHKDNDDIDICLDTCSGQEFTTQLKAWFDSKGDASLCSSIGIIKASSEKSKHLETAVLRITVTGDGVPPNTVVSLDFVQLRSETYAEDSRHPEIVVATAEEDALRRDFTINAMYARSHALLCSAVLKSRCHLLTAHMNCINEITS
jgi:tRNA nucleotidyltransferase (CCA-adding enzyme)